MHTVLKSILAAALTVCSTSALAGSVITLGFVGVTNNNATDTQIGQDQMRVTLEDLGNKVSFKFQNLGPAASSIVQVYFDTPGTVLTSLHSIQESAGVKFKSGASPSNLPGGNPIGFSADVSAEAKSQGGKQINGVNPNEWVTLTYNLSGSFDSLAQSLSNKTFRIGIHVQGYRSGGSESFVNDCPPTQAVPTPSAAAAGLLSLGIAAMRRRK